MIKFLKSLYQEDKEIYRLPKESIFDLLDSESSKDFIHREIARLYDGNHYQLVVVKLIDDIIYEVNKLKRDNK